MWLVQTGSIWQVSCHSHSTSNSLSNMSNDQSACRTSPSSIQTNPTDRDNTNHMCIVIPSTENCIVIHPQQEITLRFLCNALLCKRNHDAILCRKNHNVILCRKTHSVTFCTRNHNAILCSKIHNAIVCRRNRNAILCRENDNVRPRPKDQRKDFLKSNV